MMRTQNRQWRGLVFGILLGIAFSSLVVGAPPATSQPDQFGSPYGSGGLRLGNGLDLKLALIPAGKFMMGTQGEGNTGPQHEVTLTRPYFIGIHPVTERQYMQVMGIKRFQSLSPENFERDKTTLSHPQTAMEFSWSEAMRFCNQLSRVTGNRVRLPTEAEWERACRADTETRFFWGDDEGKMSDYAWTDRPGDTNLVGGVKGFRPVGQKKPNPWGLYDLHNWMQWCSDWYDMSYYYKTRKSLHVDPTGPQKPVADFPFMHSVRGGPDVTQLCASRIGYSEKDGTAALRVVVESPMVARQEFAGVFRFKGISQGKYMEEPSYIVSATTLGNMTGSDIAGTPCYAMINTDKPATTGGVNTVPPAKPRPEEVIKAGANAMLAIPNSLKGKNLPDPQADVYKPFKDAKVGALLKIKFQIDAGQSMGDVISVEPYKLAPGEDKPRVYVFQRTATMTLQKVDHPAVVLSKYLDETTMAVMNPQLAAALDKFKSGDSVRVTFAGKVLNSIEAYKP
jgi:hypothetical protein